MFAHGHPYNSLLSDLNLPPLDRLDNRLIEVIPNGPHLPRRTAVDTAVVPPSQPTGNHDGRTALAPVLHSTKHAGAKNTPTELTRGGRCRLLVLGIELGGRFSHKAACFRRALAQARGRPAPSHIRATTALVGRWSALLADASHTFFLQQARSPTIWQPTTTSMGTPPSLATSSATPPRHPHQPLG